jgi:hypothetical protein
MREFGGIVAALLLGACSKEAAPAGPIASSAQRVRVESDIVLAPTEPTPAFLPARDGSCPHAYRRVDESCVHHAYVPADGAALRQALDDYRRGAVPPMLGPPKPKPAPPAAKPAHDPGSLARGTGEAGAGRERRLAELDAMIAVAKEKLRERDERSRARHVESPRSAARAETPSPTPAPAAANPAPAGSAPSADPTEARLSELSQLASQLPPEQLKAITAQLGNTGMDMKELERLLSSALTGDAPR